MANQPMRTVRRDAWQAENVDGLKIGRLVAIDREGCPLVTLDEHHAPVRARVGTSEPRPSDEELQQGPKVLLWLEHGDPLSPVIVGFIRDGFALSGPSAVPEVPDCGEVVRVNGKTLLLEGEQEIVLHCGQGTLILRADGQIILKGTRLVSRASETNKIRGASVQIN
jgi:uncharacterized protein DUF6484